MGLLLTRLILPLDKRWMADCGIGKGLVLDVFGGSGVCLSISPDQCIRFYIN